MAEKNEIIKDIDEMTEWLEKRNKQLENDRLEMNEKEIPTLYKVICGGEKEIELLKEEKKETYIKFFKKNKKRVAALTMTVPLMGIGGSVIGATTAIGGASALGIGGATALGMGGASVLSGIGVFGAAGIGLSGVTIPFLLPILGGTCIYAGLKKFKQSETYKEYSEKIEKQYDICVDKAKECMVKIKKNQETLDKFMKEEMGIALEKIKDGSKKIMISIDDAMNTDQNLRIMQYQEIVLKQYNNQQEIELSLCKVVESYNKLKAENEMLLKKIAEYEDNSKLCLIANEYLK